MNIEHDYLKLLKDVLDNGKEKNLLKRDSVINKGINFNFIIL